MKEVVKQYVSVWNGKDISELKSLFTEQSKYWDALQEGDAVEVLSGSIAATHEAFPDISFEILSLVAVENRFFLEWKMTGTNTGSFFGAQPTGKKIEVKGLDCIMFELNQISEIKSFYDSSLFNQQLGIE